MWKKTSSNTWLDMNLQTEYFDGSTSIAKYDNIEEGVIYNFKIQAWNIYGFGEFSDPAEIKASTWPSSPASPVITYS